MDRKILITYASKYGATREIAEKIGEVLWESDMRVDDIYWINMHIDSSRQAGCQYSRAIQDHQASLKHSREISGQETTGSPLANTGQTLHSSPWTARNEAFLKELDSPSASPQACADLTPEGFSPRELEVLRWLKSDLSGPEIADRLVVSLNTVRFHTKNIYQKLGVNTRLKAVRWAMELGL